MIRHQYQPGRIAAPPAFAARSSRGVSTTIVQDMAEAVREMGFAGQTVSVETMTRLGRWSAAEVGRFLAEACALARELSIRQVGLTWNERVEKPICRVKAFGIRTAEGR